MREIKIISNEEYNDLFEEFPILHKFSSRLKALEKLKIIAREETNSAFISDGYETAMRMQECLYADMVTFVSKEHEKLFNGMEMNCREWKKIAESFESALKEEREANNETFDNMCALMLIDPRGTFENIILKQVERKKKAESSDGWSNWQWTLRFPLAARLKMAWKLVIGSKNIPKINEI